MRRWWGGWWWWPVAAMSCDDGHESRWPSTQRMGEATPQVLRPRAFWLASSVFAFAVCASIVEGLVAQAVSLSCLCTYSSSPSSSCLPETCRRVHQRRPVPGLDRFRGQGGWLGGWAGEWPLRCSSFLASQLPPVPLVCCHKPPAKSSPPFTHACCHLCSLQSTPKLPSLRPTHSHKLFMPPLLSSFPAPQILENEVPANALYKAYYNQNVPTPL